MVAVLRLRDVIERVRLSKSTVYAKVAEGSFPAPVRLSARAVGFIESEVDAWLKDRIQNSRTNLGAPRA